MYFVELSLQDRSYHTFSPGFIHFTIYARLMETANSD